MSTRQLNLGDFAAHCVDELKTVEQGKTIIEILSSGKVIAIVTPPPVAEEGTLAEWLGAGAALMRYGSLYDPNAPAFEPGEWEEFGH